MKLSSWHDEPVTLFGVDLAWGDRNPDGLARLDFPDGALSPPVSIEVSLVRGENFLLDALVETADTVPVFVAVDAPTIGPNETGSRPVDRECSRLFRREEAGCHPVNRGLCQRPFRIAEALAKRGFALSSDLSRGPRLLAEVYPHPAMIRFFGIPKTIKYKRGPVQHRRREFSRYQDLTKQLLARHFLEPAGQPIIDELLSAPWSKGVEDRLDALFCGLIGWWHLRHLGTQSETLGDEKTGGILLPNPSPPLSARS